MIVNGRVVYGPGGWTTCRYATYCALCFGPVQPGDRIIRVNAKEWGSQWAGSCCEIDAVWASGNPYLIAHLPPDPDRPPHEGEMTVAAAVEIARAVGERARKDVPDDVREAMGVMVRLLADWERTVALRPAAGSRA